MAVNVLIVSLASLWPGAFCQFDEKICLMYFHEVS